MGTHHVGRTRCAAVDSRTRTDVGRRPHRRDGDGACEGDTGGATDAHCHTEGADVVRVVGGDRHSTEEAVRSLLDVTRSHGTRVTTGSRARLGDAVGPPARAGEVDVDDDAALGALLGQQLEGVAARTLVEVGRTVDEAVDGRSPARAVDDRVIVCRPHGIRRRDRVGTGVDSRGGVEAEGVVLLDVCLPCGEEALVLRGALAQQVDRRAALGERELEGVGRCTDDVVDAAVKKSGDLTVRDVAATVVLHLVTVAEAVADEGDRVRTHVDVGGREAHVLRGDGVAAGGDGQRGEALGSDPGEVADPGVRVLLRHGNGHGGTHAGTAANSDVAADDVERHPLVGVDPDTAVHGDLGGVSGTGAVGDPGPSRHVDDGDGGVDVHGGRAGEAAADGDRGDALGGERVDREIARAADAGVLGDPRLGGLGDDLDVDAGAHTGRPTDGQHSGEGENGRGVLGEDGDARRREPHGGTQVDVRPGDVGEHVHDDGARDSGRAATGASDREEREVTGLGGADGEPRATGLHVRAAAHDRLDDAVSDDDDRGCADPRRTTTDGEVAGGEGALGSPGREHSDCTERVDCGVGVDARAHLRRP